jgi:broad specificity phosphatase PhoE
MKSQKKIIIIRHAEKPIREGDQRLSALGLHRAEKWKEYIPQNFGTPDTIYATAPSPHSIRPLQTILPLFESLENAQLIASIEDDKARELGKSLVSCLDLADPITLICWHHGKIPDLLKGLGAKHHEYPDPWPEDDFGTALVVTFDTGEPVVTKFKM